jgi:hypothetical protein
MRTTRRWDFVSVRNIRLVGKLGMMKKFMGKSKWGTLESGQWVICENRLTHVVTHFIGNQGLSVEIDHSCSILSSIPFTIHKNNICDSWSTIQFPKNWTIAEHKMVLLLFIQYNNYLIMFGYVVRCLWTGRERKQLWPLWFLFKWQRIV